ncbi:HPP family protein [Natrinema sp. SYSU A 869]|uniref:HPP family protein n=1 Tax=Natrinema sp. SYSU A 869 TaxID=2871694 RepID=UPI001CA3EA5E|nr:HPP family protein [Natrinema sp. SYSU A 869]
MREGIAFSTLYSGVLLTILGVLAWVTGRTLIFPSLGPSAFLLATVRDSEVTTSRRVVGGHLIGVVAGLIAYHSVAAGLGVTTARPMLATAQLRLAASGVFAVMLTSGGMLATDTVHPPACATTLIVSLGFLSSLADGAFIMLAIVVLVTIHKLVLHEWSFGEYVPISR